MKRTSKKILSLILIITLSFTLAGCWDSRELEEQAFVMAMGVDRAENNLLLFTFQLGVPGGMPGGSASTGKDKENSFTTISVKASTLFSAINVLNSCIDRTINLTHTKVYIVGQQLAKEDPFPIRGFPRFREVRPDIYIMVAEGTAKEVLEAFNPVPKTNPSKFIEVMVKNTSTTGLIPATRLGDYITKLESDSTEPVLMLIGKSRGFAVPSKAKASTTAPYIPGQIPRSGGNPVEIIGAAVFRQSKLVGTLTGSENRSRQQITGEFKSGFISLPDPHQPGRYVGIELKQNSAPRIKITFQGDIPVISVTLKCEGDLSIVQGSYNYTDPAKLKTLDEITTKQIEKVVTGTIHKCQNMGSDVYGFGDVARRNFATWDEWEKVHWSEKFPKAKIVVHVDFSLRRIGLRFEPVIPGR